MSCDSGDNNPLSLRFLLPNLADRQTLRWACPKIPSRHTTAIATIHADDSACFTCPKYNCLMDPSKLGYTVQLFLASTNPLLSMGIIQYIPTSFQTGHPAMIAGLYRLRFRVTHAKNAFIEDATRRHLDAHADALRKLNYLRATKQLEPVTRTLQSSSIFL